MAATELRTITIKFCIVIASLTIAATTLKLQTSDAVQPSERYHSLLAPQIF